MQIDVGFGPENDSQKYRLKEDSGLYLHGNDLHLGPTALKLLVLLVRNAPDKLSNRVIADDLHAEEPEWDNDENKFAFEYVGQIRKALEPDGKEAIRTERNIGYRFAWKALPWPKPPEAAQTALTEAFRKQSDDYLARLRLEFEHINAGAIYQDSVQAATFPVKDVYVPLRATSDMRAAEDSAPLLTTGRNRPEKSAQRLEKALIHQHLVIRGAPGSGKSTFVRCAVFELCHEQKGETPLDLPQRFFPLYIKIADLADHINRARKVKAKGYRRDDPKWIAHFLGALNWGASRKFFEFRLRCPDTLLFLDGLDEAPGEKSRETMAKLLVQTARTYTGCRIVLTTRPSAFKGEARPEGFEVVDIQDFDDDEIRMFVEKWCKCKYADAKLAASESDRLARALQMLEIQAARLAHNPLMLAALTVIHFNGGEMPRSRQELYQTVLRWLAKARSHLPGLEKWERRLERFRRLALAMQCKKGGRAITLPVGDAANELRTNLPRHFENTKSALDYLALEEDGGVLMRVDRHIQFSHPTFGEYLAAEALGPMDKAEIEDKIWEHQRLYSPDWREVMRFLPGVLYGLWDDKADWLFNSILDRTGTTVADRARTVALLTLLRDELRRSDRKSDGSVIVTEFPVDQRLARFTREMVALFDDPAAGEGLDARTRADAAEAWERLGDLSRLRLPSDGKKYWASVGSLKIGRYPVTVGEYAKFVEAEPKREPRDWSGQSAWQAQLDYPYRPVVWVTWHDADAYCKWAHKTYGCVRPSLPESEEWQLAAEGEGKPARIYPWADGDPDDQKATFGNNVGRSTPVGLFPAGNTDKGISDLAGNVWEWTNSDFDVKDMKVLRGGAFGDGSVALRAAYRYGVQPDFRVNYIGFRCVGE